MLNGKNKAILFIFMILFFTAAVNAESVNDADIQSVEIMNVESDNYVASIDTAAENSFTELNKTVNGNQNTTITLDKDYTYNDATDSDLKKGILINRTLTIDGNGFTIDGSHSARIFNVTENGTLTLKNIKLINGNASENGGGAIYNVGALNIINSTFANNSADYEGGAIYTEEGNLTITNSTFTSNRANEGSGGAVYSSYGNLTIADSVFMNNNVSDGEGGAICAEEGNITLINSKFINNTAYEGGAIYCEYGNVSMINSAFINNRAEEDGGGVLIYEGDVTVINSEFVNNTSEWGIGGAIMIDRQGKANVINSTFINNRAEGGGAIYHTGSNMTITNSTFINNTAEEDGGGAIVTEEGLIVINSKFINNKLKEETEGGGGAIFCFGDTTIINSTFVNNTDIIYGGAIYCEGHIDIINSSFKDNKAFFEEDEGEIYVWGAGGAVYANSATVVNSEFINNMVGGNEGEGKEYYYDECSGGAIFCYDNMTIINSTFVNNSIPSGKGGALYSEDGPINITDSTFIGNSAENGGAVYGYSNLTVTNSKFFNNNATKGGAIHYGEPWEEDMKLTITGSTFDGNTGEYGDDIYTEHDTTVLNNTFSRSSYANIYANNTIINCSVISALENTTYYVLANSTFKVYVMVLADGASVNGYNITIIDKENNTVYNTTYVGQGKYESTVDIVADFKVRPYTAELHDASVGSVYIIQDGLVSTEKQDVEIEVTVDDTVFGKGVTGNITIKDANGNVANFTGEVTVEIDGENYTVNVTEGKGSFVIDDKLNAGNHTLNVGFKGDEKYNPSNATVYFEIGKANPDLNVTITDITGNNATVEIIMNPNINGNVTVIIDNQTIVVEIRNGTGKLVLSDLESGNHNFTVEFDGNDNYNQAATEGEFNIEEGIVLEVDELIKYYRSNKTLNIRLLDTLGNPIANKTVTIKINNVTYTRTTDENGQILMNINLIPGIYEAEVSYENLTETVNVTVITTIESEGLIKYFKNGSQYYAKFLDVDGIPLANTNVTFNIHGVLYARTTDENGIAMLNINLNPGEYVITAYNPVNNESKSNTVTVLSTIFGEKVTKFFRNGTQYYAYVLDENGNPLANANVTFNIHGVFYNRTTDENGIVKLNINLNPGEYIITAWNQWNDEATSNNITVYTVVESEDLEMTTSDRKPFTVTVLGDQGEPLANAEVTFNIHGVFYHKTTDANGQISLDINLIAGKYIITTYYNEYSISNTIVVK